MASILKQIADDVVVEINGAAPWSPTFTAVESPRATTDTRNLSTLLCDVVPVQRRAERLETRNKVVREVYAIGVQLLGKLTKDAAEAEADARVELLEAIGDHFRRLDSGRLPNYVDARFSEADLANPTAPEDFDRLIFRGAIRLEFVVVRP